MITTLLRSPHQSTGSCHQNQQCQMWAETSSIKTKLPCSETFHLRFYLVYRQQNGVPYLISTKDEWSSVSMPGTLSRAEQTRSHSNVKTSSGISRHSRTTPPPLRGQVDKSDLVVRGPFAGTEESTTKSAGITVITGYQADISWTLATTLLFLPRDGDKW